MFKDVLNNTAALISSNFTNAIKISLPWLLLNEIMTVAGGFLPTNTISKIFVLVMGLIYLLVSSASIATAWSQLILLKEKPLLIHLKFGKNELNTSIAIIKTIIIIAPLILVVATLGDVLENYSLLILLIAGILAINLSFSRHPPRLDTA